MHDFVRVVRLHVVHFHVCCVFYDVLSWNVSFLFTLFCHIDHAYDVSFDHDDAHHLTIHSLMQQMMTMNQRTLHYDCRCSYVSGVCFSLHVFGVWRSWNVDDDYGYQDRPGHDRVDDSSCHSCCSDSSYNYHAPSHRRRVPSRDGTTRCLVLR